MSGNSLEKHPNWKGGRTTASNGYVLIKDPTNPDADKRGYVYEHRVIAQKILGRPLRKGEIVHHKDGNKQNNTPENLEITEGIAEHKARHRSPGSHLLLPSHENPVILCACGCGETLLKYDQEGRPRSHIWGHSWKKGKRFATWIQETIQCACGCGTEFEKYDQEGRPRKFVTGHNLRRNQNG